MKKFLLAIGILSCAFSAQADLTGTGFYRVKNYATDRWASLIDNTGAIDFVAGSADLHALSLTNDTEEILSNPGSVVYITHLQGSQYDISAQGVTLGNIIDHPVNIGPLNMNAANGQKLYQIYGTYQGVTKYIADGNIVTSDPRGYATINDPANPNFKRWEFIPVEANSDNFFGAVPSVTVGNRLYTTLFTSFPYQPYSTGVSAYYIGRVGFGMVEMIEIRGAVPPGSPVIIQCAGSKVSDNKLQIVSSTEALPTNALTGVYFNYNYNKIVNQVEYDPETMRVLGVCSDGTLGFVTGSMKSIPANTAYLKVPAGSLPEFKCVTTAEFDSNLPDAPDYIYYDDAQVLLPQDDYNYTGTINIPVSEGETFIKFYTSTTMADETAIGPYAVNGQDVNISLDSEVSIPFSYGSPYSWVLPATVSGNVDVTLNIQYQFISFKTGSAGVNSVISSDGSFYYNGNVVYSETGGIKLFNMSGNNIASTAANSLDLSDMPKGIYIAVSNGKTIKIVR